MEQQTPSSSQPVFDLNVDQEGAGNLSGAAGWAKFFAIVVFIGIGLLIVLFVALRQQISDAIARFFPVMNGSQGFGVLAGALVFVAIICIILMVFLFKGAVLIRQGIQTKNQQTFNSGLASLKSYFILYGVLSILSILFKIIGLFAK
jgi:hypothetical protein